jgi:hypothetical protein
LNKKFSKAGFFIEFFELNPIFQASYFFFRRCHFFVQNIGTMSLRFHALNTLSNAETPTSDYTTKITGLFAENVFTHAVARQFLSDEAYKSLMGSIKAVRRLIAFDGSPNS